MWRDVPMDETENLSGLPSKLVRCVQSISGVCADTRSKLGSDGRSPLLGTAHDLPQWLAMEVLHRNPIGVVILSKVEHLGDIGVVDARGDAGLVEEHVHELVIFDEMGMDALNGDPLLKATRAVHSSEMHARHAADADLVDNPIPA
jgi:hypothetical protein